MTRRCNRRGASGFAGNLVRASSRTMERRSRRWCNNLSTLSVSLFVRGLEMARWSRWSVTRFDEGGFERSERCDRLALMRSSCSDAIFLLWRRQSSCSFSLSLSSIFQGRKSFEVKMKTEIIFRCFGSNFRWIGNAFQFDQIWSNNQTPNFPENHFRNQFKVKTNRA